MFHCASEKMCTVSVSKRIKIVPRSGRAPSGFIEGVYSAPLAGLRGGKRMGREG